MISTSGLTWWMRFPAAAYMAAMSVRGLLPQVGGVLQAFADDQHVRADLVDEVPRGGVHGGDVGPGPAAPGRRQNAPADPGPARLVHDVHRRDQRVGRIPGRHALPGREEPLGRPAVVVPDAIVVIS